MSSYVPENVVLRGALVFCYHLKKSAPEAHELLVEAFGDHALSRTQCYNWYQRFDNGIFGIDNEPRGRPEKKFDDDELEKLLAEDNSQTQKNSPGSST